MVMVMVIYIFLLPRTGTRHRSPGKASRLGYCYCDDRKAVVVQWQWRWCSPAVTVTIRRPPSTSSTPATPSPQSSLTIKTHNLLPHSFLTASQPPVVNLNTISTATAPPQPLSLDTTDGPNQLIAPLCSIGTYPVDFITTGSGEEGFDEWKRGGRLRKNGIEERGYDEKWGRRESFVFVQTTSYG
ncbi:hypothetical protein ACFE04_006378 [Oxalis oulophora]